MLVVSVFVSARPAVADDTLAMNIPFAVVDEEVRVHRYHPLRQGVIVDTEPELLPTTPVNKSKLANRITPPSAPIWAKLFVPWRKNTDMVYGVPNSVKVLCITLFPEAPVPPNKNAFSVTNIGNFPVVVRVVLAVLRAQVVEKSLELIRTFVRDSSSKKPFGALDAGSWSKRGLSGGTTSISPMEFTTVATDAIVNDATKNDTAVGAMNGIVRTMTAVVAR